MSEEQPIQNEEEYLVRLGEATAKWTAFAADMKELVRYHNSHEITSETLIKVETLIEQIEDDTKFD